MESVRDVLQAHFPGSYVTVMCGTPQTQFQDNWWFIVRLTISDECFFGEAQNLKSAALICLEEATKGD